MRLVIPSVGYADMLAVTLPAWASCVPRGAIVVVTSAEDRESQAEARAAGVRFVVTDAWTRTGSAFDKATAMNEAFGFSGDCGEPPEEGEVCIAVDADVVPFGEVGRLSREDYAPDTIYGIPRYYCPDKETLDAHAKGAITLRSMGLLSKGSDSVPRFGYTSEQVHEFALKCLGYFQLFRAKPGRKFKSHPTAGVYDGAFARSFPQRDVIPGLYVLHLGGRAKRNWSGRVVPAWR